MKKIRFILVGIFLLIVSYTALASVEANSLDWWTVEGGGGDAAQGGGYSLQGAAGQPDAGLMQGGGFSLAGGYISGAASQPSNLHKVYLPLIAR